MIAIISPAKKLDSQSKVNTSQCTYPELLNKANQLIEELRKFTPSDLEELMSISPQIAEQNYERFLRWDPEAHREGKQALFLFNGQVYAGLDAPSLDEKDISFAQDHLRILSGLYGVLKPLDLILPYRLEMGTKLPNPEGENLYEFWGKQITKKINESLKQEKNPVLVNLASQEYFKSIDSKSIDGKIISPVFKEKKGNQYKVIAIYAKKARGLMSRYMIENKLQDAEALKSFDLDGYIYNEELSSETNWVFTRR